MSHLTGVATEQIPALPTGRRRRPGLRLWLLFVVLAALGLLQHLALQPVEARSVGTSAISALPYGSAGAPAATWVSHFSPITATSPVTVYLPFVGRDYRTLISYFDDFSDSQSGWATGDDGKTRWSYVDGEYEILVRNPGRWAGSLCPAGKVVSYSVEADIRNEAGAGIVGLIFGWIDWDHFYLFIVSPDTRYYVVMRHNGTMWDQLIPWTYSPLLYPYGATNRLKVARQGAQIAVYINDVFLETIKDSAFLGAVQTGLYVQTDQSAATVRFDNFRLEEQ